MNGLWHSLRLSELPTYIISVYIYPQKIGYFTTPFTVYTLKTPGTLLPLLLYIPSKQQLLDFPLYCMYIHSKHQVLYYPLYCIYPQNTGYLTTPCTVYTLKTPGTLLPLYCISSFRTVWQECPTPVFGRISAVSKNSKG